MKLQVDDDMMIGSSNMNSRKFTIQSSSKAFKILSKNLYKNQIRAIIRELSCNAVDAHILAGHKRSFDISLPTSLDERFVIRDFGPGLSHEDIEEMYTTYFASTKSNSNDFIGALGLGSKSPFGYTDTFSVVSYFNGRARGYTACLDNGEPTLIDTFDIESDEPTGLEITVPVKNGDVHSWAKEARYVFKTFLDIKPNFIGYQPEVTYLPNKPYFISESKNYNSSYFAIMGKIAYPLSSELFKNTYIAVNMLTEHSYSEFYINFELGDLDITPSREEITLDERTTAIIKDRIKEISDEMAGDFLESLKDMSDRELVKYFQDRHYSLVNFAVANYKDRDLKALTDYYTASVTSKDMVSYRITDSGEAKRTTVKAGVKFHGNKKYKGLMNIFSIHMNKATVFIDDVKGKQRPAKIAQYLCTNNVEGLYHLVLDELSEDFEKDKAEILKLMANNVDFIKLSSIKVDSAAKEREFRPRTPNAYLKSLDKDGYYYNSKELFLTANEVRALEGIYVKMYLNSYTWANGKQISEYNLNELLMSLGIKKYYVIRPAAYNYINDAAKAVKLEDYASDKIRKLEFTKENILPRESKNTLLKRIDNNQLTWVLDKIMGGYNFDAKISKILKSAHNADLKDAGIPQDVEDKLNKYKLYTESNKLEIEKNADDFQKRNPILDNALTYNMSKEYKKDLKDIFEGKIK